MGGDVILNPSFYPSSSFAFKCSVAVVVVSAAAAAAAAASAFCHHCFAQLLRFIVFHTYNKSLCNNRRVNGHALKIVLNMCIYTQSLSLSLFISIFVYLHFIEINFS